MTVIAMLALGLALSHGVETPRTAVPETSEEEQESEERPERGFGGPDQVENQLAADAEPKPTVFRFDGIQRGLAPYFGFKERLKKDRGISFGMDYSAVSFSASESAGEDRASSGMFRFFGDWELTGRGTTSPGKLVLKVENRHAYSAVAPKGLALETGYVGFWEAPFSDEGWRLTNLYWLQRFSEGNGVALFGFLDVTDYVDVYAMASPWLHFMNLAFSTGSASIALPPDATLGAMVGGFVSDTMYVQAGISDANARPTDPFNGFDTFVNDNEYFSHLELGWTPSYDRRYFDNLHFTLWHVDELEAAATNAGWGINGSYTRFIGDKWLPFLRGGYAEDGGSLLSKSVSAGVGYYMRERADLLGFGLNWGEPNKDTFGPGLSNQIAAELFYRVQFSPNFAITPDLQYIKDPALNPGVDSTWVLGLRARLAL